MIFSVISSYGQAAVVCKDITVILDSSGNATIAENAVDGGSTGTGTLTFDTDKTIFNCSDIGSNTVTLTVTDSFDGSTDSCPAIVTVVDVTPPTAICQDVTVNLDATGNATITPSQIDNGSSDVCTAVTLGLSKTTFDCSNIGSNTVTLTVTDVAGNSSTCIATVTVVDNEDPTISCVGDQTKSTDAGACYYTVIGTEFDPASYGDNCNGSTIINDFNASATLAGAQIPNGTTITWTVTDGSGNTASCIQTITVVDNEDPTITCATPSTTYITDSNQCTYTVLSGDNSLNPITTGDNCAVATVSNDYNGLSTLNGTTFPLGITTVVWTVIDITGNSTDCSYDIEVVDGQAPVISICPNDIIVNTDLGNCDAIVSWTLPDVTDNCTALNDLIWTSTHNPGDAFGIGITTVTYTINDESGNDVICSFTVTVRDNEPPEIPTLPDLTAQCSLTAIAPTTVDNCGGTITGTTGVDLTFDTQGTEIIYWAFDDGVNLIIVPQNVIINDTDDPVVGSSLPDFSIVGCEIGSISELTIPTANDNCNGLIDGVLVGVDFPYSIIGTSTITWYFIDAVGNTSSQTQNIILTPPSIDGGTLLGELTNNGGSTPDDEIDITSCTGETNIIEMNLSGEIGTIIRWEKFEAGDEIWVPIANTTDSHTVTFDSSNNISTYFKVLIQVGTCTIYSNSVYIRAVPPDTPPVLDDDYFEICLYEEIALIARSNHSIEEDALAGDGGDFQSGQFPDKFNEDMWRIDGAVAAAYWTANANAGKPTNWSGTNPHEFGAITYDSGSPKFGMAQGDYYSNWIEKNNPQVFEGETTLETPIFSLVDITTASLDFDQAYNLESGDYAILELSLDGGGTYTITLQSLVGPVTWDYNHSRNNTSNASNYNFDTDDSSFDLSAYIDNSAVRARWTYHGTTVNSAWAIDGIAIPIEPILEELEWTDGIGDPDEQILANGQIESTFYYTPDAPGFHQYGATTLVDGCRSYDEEGTALADVYVNYSYAGEDQSFTNGDCGENYIQLNAYDNTLTANENAIKGAFTIPDDCINCDDLGTMAQGIWSVAPDDNNSCGEGSFSNTSDPDAIFTGEAGVYILTWTVNGCDDDVRVEITNCDTINFDGVNDYVDFKEDNYDLDGPFSLEVWVKAGSTSSPIHTIFSKRDANSPTKGYDLSIDNNGEVSFNWNESGSISSAPYNITNDRWYHIAVTHSGNQYRLYIDGVQVGFIGGGSPVANDFRCILGAMDYNNSTTNKALSEPVNYFNGWLDELRIWNVELSEEQIHQMMNQEIIQDPSGTNVFGEVVPIDINGLPWSNLEGYYRMEIFNCGYLWSNFWVGIKGKLRNINTSENQSAPLPYTTRASDQNWATDDTWTEYDVWDPPNSLGVNGEPIDWNIVQLGHNINSGDKNITVLGLISNTGELTMMNSGAENESNQGQMLWVTHYLKLDGSIDLVGESQLIQKPYLDAQHYESWLDESSKGFIERDQQGTMNSFAYNYWSSPVSKWGSGIGNNTAITIEEILNDGTISTDLKNIDFGPPNDYYYADGDLTSPVKIASAWIWKFVNNNSNYANWIFLGSNTGTLGITEGYSMKGVDGDGTLDLKVENQNYAFKGRPNNAVEGLELAGTDLVHTVFTPGYNVSLTGNPFPSALDGDQFIVDNQNSTDATLYFWEHWSSGTHEWELYQGGYAIRKVNNGVPAVSHADGVTGGASRSVPGRYIPVGQGFYVIGDEDGGPVVFRNNQRIFRRETEHGGSSSVFIKGKKGKKNTAIPEDIVDTTMRIRLGFESPDGFHRQVLASFFEGPTDGIDYLYDAKAGDFLANDAFFIQEDQYFVIQAYGEFNVNREIPISVFIDENHSGGVQKFMVDGLENIPDKVEIYIKDYYNKGETYNIKNGSSFEIALESGEHKDRFALVFKSRLLELDEIDKIEDGVILFMNNTSNEIIIQKLAELDFKQVTLFNYLGQVIRTWTSRGLNLRNIRLPVGEVSTGIYIVNLETEQGYITKKVLIE